MAKKTAKSAKSAPAKKPVAKSAAKTAKAKPSAKSAAKSPAKSAAKGILGKAKDTLMKLVSTEEAPKAKKAAKASKVEETPKTAKTPKAAEPKAAKAAAPKAETTANEVETPAPAQLELTPAKPAKAPKVKMTKAAKAAAVASSEDEARWIDLHQRYSGEKAQTYDMRGTFEAGKPLQHKVLGWGWILSNENDRLEVLFRDGRRMLISNYNPTR